MIGRAALRCKKTRSQEMCCTSSSKEDLCRAAARKMNLKRRKMSTLQQWIWNCQKWNKVVANSQNLRPRANKNGPRDCSKVHKIETTQTTGCYRSKTHKKMRKITACVLQNTTQDPRETERNNGPHDRMMPNQCEATSLWRVS